MKHQIATWPLIIEMFNRHGHSAQSPAILFIRINQTEGCSMAYYFVQHGKSYSKEDDPQQSLTEEGIQETKKVAEALGTRIIKLNHIYHSGKKRAEQTALIFAQIFGLENEVKAIDGINPMDDVKSFALVLPDDTLIVSHLPFLEKLTNYLVGGDESLKTNIVDYTNSHVVCLEKNMHTGFQVAWIY